MSGGGKYAYINSLSLLLGIRHPHADVKEPSPHLISATTHPSLTLFGFIRYIWLYSAFSATA